VTLRTRLEHLDTRSTRWLTAPEPNAAGRMGLFRIIYALFYLWYLATNPVETMRGYRVLDFNSIKLVEVLPTFSPVSLRLIQAGLVAALVLLALGYHTRIATGAVLVLGVVLEAISASIDLEHSTVLLVAFIPLLMLVDGHWGDTYSVDALRARSRGDAVVSPRDPSGERFVGARAIFVVLALLFASAGISKLLPSSTWFSHPDLIASLILELNVENVIEGLPANPTAGPIAETQVVHQSMRLGVVVLELSFLAALFSVTLRQLVIASALVFHSFNALLLGISFTPILIAYAPFVDWQGLLDRALPRRSPRPAPKHAAALAPIALIAALVAASMWYANDALEDVLTVGGALEWRTIWYLVLPLALGWLLVQLVAIGKGVRRATAGPLGMDSPP
jgi:hypothetical protein